MRAHIHRSQLIDEIARIIALVGAQRDACRPIGAGLDHGERGDAF